MSHIVGLKIQNFACYRGDQTIQLGPGCYAITAEHIQDKTRSNWLGKSTLSEAIRWCLRGKVPNKDKADTLDDLITRGESISRIDLELSDGAIFSREKKRGVSATFEVSLPGIPNNLKNADAQEALDAYLGLSDSEMLTTNWADQGDLPVLVKATSGELTKMVEDWLGDELSKLVDAQDDVTALLAQATEDHRKALEQVELLEKHEPLVKSYEIGIPELEKQFAKDKKEYEAATKAKAEWNVRGKLNASIRELETLRKAEEDVKKPFVFNEPTTERLDVLEKKCRNDLEAAKKTRDDYTSRVKNLKMLVRGEFDGKCPVSKGFDCPATSEINKGVGASKVALQALEADLGKASAFVQKIEAELEEVLQSKRRRNKEETEKAQREGKLGELSKRIKDLDASIRNSKAEGILPIKPEEQPPVVPSLPDSSKLELAKIHLQQAREAVDALPEARACVLETAKVVRAHRLALSILGPEGARRKAAEGVVSSIELDANKLLSDAGIELSLKALWGRETGALAEQCYECGNAFPSSAKIKECSRCGSARGNKIKHEFRWKLSNVSGAGLDLGGLGIRTAAYRWLKKKRNVSWSVAFLDEVAGQLDQFHRRSVSANIRKMLIGTYEQVWVTAHDSGSLEACDKRIHITSDGKYSKIKVI